MHYTQIGLYYTKVIKAKNHKGTKNGLKKLINTLCELCAFVVLYFFQRSGEDSEE